MRFASGVLLAVAVVAAVSSLFYVERRNLRAAVPHLVIGILAMTLCIITEENA